MNDELADYEKQLLREIQGLQRESLQSGLESFHSYSPTHMDKMKANKNVLKDLEAQKVKNDCDSEKGFIEMVDSNAQVNSSYSSGKTKRQKVSHGA